MADILDSGMYVRSFPSKSMAAKGLSGLWWHGGSPGLPSGSAFGIHLPNDTPFLQGRLRTYFLAYFKRMRSGNITKGHKADSTLCDSI